MEGLAVMLIEAIMKNKFLDTIGKMYNLILSADHVVHGPVKGNMVFTYADIKYNNTVDLN